MARIIAIIAAFALISPLQAQELCPLVLHTGNWTGKTAGDTMIFRDGNEVSRKRDSSGPQEIVISGDVCKRQITVDFVGVPFPMAEIAAGDGTAIFNGVSSLNGIDAGLAITVIEPAFAEGEISTGKIVKGGHAGMTTPLEFTFKAEDAAVHPACACMTPLKIFLKDQIQNATLWRDAYKNQSLRKLPSGVDSDLWDSRLYDRLVTYYVDGVLAEVANPAKSARERLKGDLATDEAAAQDTVEETEETQSVGATDMVNCNEPKVTPSTDTCYPGIATQSTWIHEQRHKKDCDSVMIKAIAGGGKPPKDHFLEIVHWAQSDVDAYQAEINFLNSWIPKNCG